MERTSTLFGSRVMLRPLVLSDFPSWREVRVRCADWLLKWEPQRLPHQPDTTQDAEPEGYTSLLGLCPQLFAQPRLASEWYVCLGAGEGRLRLPTHCPPGVIEEVTGLAPVVFHKATDYVPTFCALLWVQEVH